MTELDTTRPLDWHGLRLEPTELTGWRGTATEALVEAEGVVTAELTGWVVPVAGEPGWRATVFLDVHGPVSDCSAKASGSSLTPLDALDLAWHRVRAVVIAQHAHIAPDLGWLRELERP